MGRFLDQIKHAFAVTPESSDGAPLPQGLNRFAEETVARGLETPVILFLETTRPLSFIAGQTLHALRPLLAPFMDDASIAEVARALEDKRVVRRLIERIEALVQNRV